MNIRELIAELAKLDEDRIVIVSDANSNKFTPLDNILGIARFKDGKIGLAELTAETRGLGYTEEDVITDGKSAVILYPK